MCVYFVQYLIMKERGEEMDGLAVFLIVAITIALVFIIATSIVFMIAFYKLYGYIKVFLETKD